MKKFKISAMCLLFAAMFFAVVSAKVQAQSPQETLNQYISDLQKNPDDNALREKIIKLAQEIKPPLALSDEARKHLDRGVAAIEGAKSEEDFKDACAEFTQVLTIAPWFGPGYRPLAIAQDKTGQYDAALKSLGFYLLSQPSSEDVAWAKSLINKIEYRKEKAAKESSPEVVAAEVQKKSEDWLKKLDGRRYTCPGSGGTAVIDVRGGFFIFGAILGGRYNEASVNSRIEIRGRETRVRLTRPVFNDEIDITDIISEDGGRITARCRYADGNVREDVYLWQR